MQAGIINDNHPPQAKHNKPVYAVVEETCASAAYCIAAAADEIFVDKASIVGSMVSSWMVSVLPAPWKKLGVGVACSRPGKQGFLDPFSPRPNSSAPMPQNHAEPNPPAVHCRGEGRSGDRLKTTPETFSGLFWTGQQAAEMGF